MPTSTLLELHLHLVNGNTRKFAQNDPEAVEQILGQMNQTIFSQPTLVVHGHHVATTYRTSALIGISLLMDPLPESLLRLTHKLRHGVGEIQEISEAQYNARLHEMKSTVAGQPAVRLNEIEFVSGHRIWLEVSIESAVNDMQERQLVKHAFEGPTLVSRRIDSGVSIWNRAQMVSYSFTPKPEVPMPALPAEFVGV